MDISEAKDIERAIALSVEASKTVRHDLHSDEAIDLAEAIDLSKAIALSEKSIVRPSAYPEAPEAEPVPVGGPEPVPVPDTKVTPLVFAYSAFPRANHEFGRYGFDEGKAADYIARFIDTASRTIVAMVDATPKEALGTCCIFNPVGGGAFLRGIGEAMEGLILSLIPCILAAAYARACRFRPGKRVMLLTVGAQAAEEAPGRPKWSAVSLPTDADLPMPVAAWLAHLREDLAEHFKVATQHPRRFQLPPGVRTARGDMLAIAQCFRAQRPGWTCALTMAADERRIGNFFLGISKYNGRSIGAMDPYNGACRASDENTTRRTTLLEVAMATGALGLRRPDDGVPAALSGARCEALAHGFHQRAIQRVPWTDRAAVVDGYGAPALDECLDDIDSVRKAQERSGHVLEVLKRRFSSDDWRLPPYAPQAASAGASKHVDDDCPPLDKIPSYGKWTVKGKDAGPTNSAHRLGLFGYNFYRALGVLQAKGPEQVLRDARLRWGGEPRAGEWVITVRAEEVLGHDLADGAINREDWAVVGRFQAA